MGFFSADHLCLFVLLMLILLTDHHVSCGKHVVRFKNDLGTIVYGRSGRTKEEAVVGSGETTTISNGEEGHFDIDPSHESLNLFCVFVWFDSKTQKFMSKGFEASNVSIFKKFSKTKADPNHDIECVYKLMNLKILIYFPESRTYIPTEHKWENHATIPIPLPEYVVEFLNDLGTTAYGNCGYSGEEALNKQYEEFHKGVSFRWNIDLKEGFEFFCVFVWIDRENGVFMTKDFQVFTAESSNEFYGFYVDHKRISYYKLRRKRIYIRSPLTGDYITSRYTWDVNTQNQIPDSD